MMETLFWMDQGVGYPSLLQVVLFREEKVITFTPLKQHTESTHTVTGDGFIPCKG